MISTSLAEHLRRPLGTVSLAAFALLAFAADPAVSPARGQITPPKPGVEFPDSYYQVLAENPNAFRFGRAWKKETARVRRNRERMQGEGSAMPTLPVGAVSGFRVEGTRRMPVLAGKYANTGLTPYTVADLQQQLFDGPNPDGTITDFYNEISYGFINITGDVIGDGVGGLLQVSQDDTYYEGSSGCNGLSTACGARTYDYLKEMLDGTDPHTDFSQYDNDGPDGIPNSGDDDGYVDFVAFVQPETGGECGNDNMWSHRFEYEIWWGAPYTTDDPAAGGGFILVNDYTIQPMISCFGINQLIEIGVYAHEIGHAFGLPDLYDIDFNNGTSQGIGEWGLMAAGSWGGDGAHPETPTHMSAWSKEQLGWVDPILIRQDQDGLSLPAVETSGTVFKVWPHGDPGPEYFLIENRVQTGYDLYLHTSGIAVWHIDNNQPDNGDEFQKLVDLEEADGLFHLDFNLNRGDAGDLYPGTFNKQLFDDNTTPSARDRAGAPTGFSVGNFGAVSDPRTFDVTVTPSGVIVGDVTLNDVPLGNGNGILNGFERANLVVGVQNASASPFTGIVGTLTSLHPDVVVLQNTVTYDTVTPGVQNFGASEFEIESVGPMPDGTQVRFQLDLVGDDDYSSSSIFTIFGGAFILLVEDDGPEANSSYFEDAIAGAGRFYTHHDVDTQGIPELSVLQAAGKVVWYTGGDSDFTFTPQEQDVVQQFLDGGGALFVTGEDIGYDLVSNGTAADQLFYTSYLHANYEARTASDFTLEGIVGDPIGDGIDLTLIGGDGAGNSLWPSRISTGPGAVLVLQYSFARYGGLRYDGSHKVVYFSFNFEAINAAATRTLLMQRVLDWLTPEDVIPPTVTLTGPLGGEVLDDCATRVVTWTATDNVGVVAVDLSYSDDGGVSYPHVIAAGISNTGSYDWNEPGLSGTGFRVQVAARDAVGLQGVSASGSNFTIQVAAPLAVQVLTPDGGETYGLSATEGALWTTSGACGGTDSTRVFLSTDGGGSWTDLATVSAPDTGLVWTTPGAPTDSGLVRVEAWLGGVASADTSDGFFTVVDDAPPTVSLLSPNGGETISGAGSFQIDATVTDNMGVDSVCVSYSIDDGENWTVIECGALSFPYLWATPSEASVACRVRVEAWDETGSSAVDVSDNPFTLFLTATAVPPELRGVTRPVLLQNRPNPMGARSTVFSFYLPAESRVALQVHDLSGRLVRTLVDRSMAGGYHEHVWDGTDEGGGSVAQGVYFYVLQTPDRRQVRKLVKLR